MPFVSEVTLSANTAQFLFAGDDTARARLLSALVQQGVEVVEFGGKTETLEDAFMAITRGVMQ